MSSAAGEEDLPSLFADIPALVHDHSYLPVRFDGLVDNALMDISGKDNVFNFAHNRNVPLISPCLLYHYVILLY